MPQKTKVNRSSKKKNKGQSGATSNNHTSASNGNNKKAASEAVSAFSKDTLVPKVMSHNLSHSRPSYQLYIQVKRYKEATKAFWDGLRLLLPSTFRLTAVNDLSRGCNHLYKISLEAKEFLDNLYGGINQCEGIDDILSQGEQQSIIEKFKHVLVPYSIISNLDISISLRCDVMHLYPLHDDGHEHFIKVLSHCKYLLTTCRDLTNVIWQMKRNLERRNTTFTNLHDKEEDNSSSANYVAYIVKVKSPPVIEPAYFASVESSPVTDETDIYTIEDDLIRGLESFLPWIVPELSPTFSFVEEYNSYDSYEKFD